MSLMVQNTGTKYKVYFCPSKFCLQTAENDTVTCSDLVVILWLGHYSVPESFYD